MYDTGEGAIHDCHDRAHDAKERRDCAPTKDECLRLVRGGPEKMPAEAKPIRAARA
jgi:hypothetical protein